MCSYVRFYQDELIYLSVWGFWILGRDTLACKVEQMTYKNVVSWNTIISGLTFNGKAELGIEMFEDMISVQWRRAFDGSSFVGVLTCFSHAKLVEKSQYVFALMSAWYKL